MAERPEMVYLRLESTPLVNWVGAAPVVLTRHGTVTIVRPPRVQAQPRAIVSQLL